MGLTFWLFDAENPTACVRTRSVCELQVSTQLTKYMCGFGTVLFVPSRESHFNTVLNKFLGCLKACLVPLQQSTQGSDTEKRENPILT